jgi:hypothetical protein
MKQFRILLFFIFISAGCATHYQCDEPEAIILFYLRAPTAGHVQIAAGYQTINGSVRYRPCLTKSREKQDSKFSGTRIHAQCHYIHNA